MTALIWNAFFSLVKEPEQGSVSGHSYMTLKQTEKYYRCKPYGKKAVLENAAHLSASAPLPEWTLLFMPLAESLLESAGPASFSWCECRFVESSGPASQESAGAPA